MKVQLKLPEENDFTMVKHLTFKHRNSLEISLFVSHLKTFINRGMNLYENSLLSDKDDKPLINYSFNKRPLWISARHDVLDETIFDLIDNDLHSFNLCKSDEKLVIYDRDHISEESSRFRMLKNWCQNHDWMLVHYEDFTGCEASVVVIFELHFNCLESNNAKTYVSLFNNFI